MLVGTESHVYYNTWYTNATVFLVGRPCDSQMPCHSPADHDGNFELAGKPLLIYKLNIEYLYWSPLWARDSKKWTYYGEHWT